jgi:DNA-binding Lrp family transcriptional regulator
MIATAFVLVNVRAGAARRVMDELHRVDGIQDVEAVSGPYDLIAVVQGSDFNAIGRLVLEKIQAIDGVTATLSCNVIRFEP